jgi:hypothetical protein
MRRTATIVLSSLLATLFAVNVFGSTDTIRKGFNVAPGGTLRLSAGTGNVKIVSGGTGVAIEIIRTADGKRAEERLREHRIEISQSGNDVIIDGTMKEKWGLRFDWSDYDVQWNVRVPSTYNVEVKTAGGSIELADIGGTVQARTAGGHIRTGRLAGKSDLKTAGGSIHVASAGAPLEVSTAGGSITIGNTAGSVDAHTSGGSIHLGTIGGSVVARTSGGGIDIEGAVGSIDASTSGGSIEAKIAGALREDSRLSTSGGHVTLAIAAGVGAEVDAKSSGTIRSDLPITVNGSIGRNELRGRLGSGGPRLVLRSSGGGIRLKTL